MQDQLMGNDVSVSSSSSKLQNNISETEISNLSSTGYSKTAQEYTLEMENKRLQQQMEDLKRIIEEQREENLRLQEQVRKEVHATVDGRIDERMETKFQQMMDLMITQWTTHQPGHTMNIHNQIPQIGDIEGRHNDPQRLVAKSKVRQIMDATTPPRNKVRKYDVKESATPMEGQSPT
jgi:hypothetical protein